MEIGNINNQLLVQSFAQCGNGSGRAPRTAPMLLSATPTSRWGRISTRQRPISNPHCSVGVKILPLKKIYALETQMSFQSQYHQMGAMSFIDFVFLIYVRNMYFCRFCISVDILRVWTKWGVSWKMKKFPTIMSVACFIIVPSAASSLLQRISFSKPGL